MSGCLIIGDSIAVGLAALMPFCRVDASVGLGSAAIVDKVRPAETLIVSAGSNDAEAAALLANLQAIRRRATGRVVWLLPARDAPARAVHAAAMVHWDRAVAWAAGPDGVHPASYADLARRVCLP